MDVLLSHVAEEAPVAAALAQWIESTLDRDVHVIGEPESEQDVEQRLAEVEQALGDARAVLLLCSARSIGRPWTGFACGCAWSKRVRVIAVCHAGCAADDLPPPLGSCHAFDLADVASCQSLMETLAGHLERKRVPRISYDQMVAELEEAMEPARPAAPRAGRSVAAAPSAPARGASRPPSQTIPIEARLLAAVKRLPGFTCTAPGLAQQLGEQERRVRQTLDKLVSENLLAPRISTLPSDPETRYAVTDKGRTYLGKKAA